MTKTTTIDHTSILEMALVGFELQRNRIEAAIAEIQAELGQGGPSRSNSTVSTTAEPKTTRQKRFSAAARKRLAAAQKKRWAELKTKKAQAKKAKPTVTPKRKKARVGSARKQRPVQAKAAKKVVQKARTASKPKARISVVNVKKAVTKPSVENSAPPVPATDSTSSEASV
jgi:hypothetical protein